MSIQELLRLLPAPEFPEESTSRSNWSVVEADLQCRLPSDYKELVEIYGSGCFDGFLWVLNPFSGNPNIELRSQVSTRLNALRSLKMDFGEEIPFPLYPQVGGLIPWAFTDNGDVLYWITGESVADWPVAVNAGRESDWRQYELSSSGFLVALFDRQLRVDIFPEDFPSRYPAFTPLSTH